MVVKDKDILVELLPQVQTPHRKIGVDILPLQSLDHFFRSSPVLLVKQGPDLCEQFRTAFRHGIVVRVGAPSPQSAFIEPDQVVCHPSVDRGSEMSVSNRQRLLEPRRRTVIIQHQPLSRGQDADKKT